MNQRADSEHAPVLLQAAVDALAVRADGLYVDATFGRGGHSRRLLQGLGSQGRLVVIDRDPVAFAVAQQWAQQDNRISAYHGAFTMLEQMAINNQWLGRVDGVLLDLGVSSPQLDDPARGFSFRASGPLDMRMDTSRGLSAAQWLATEDEAVIEKVIRDYGEERFARRIARAICAHRDTEALTDTATLADIVAAAVPTRERGKHPATRTFQAIRIHVNRELDELRDVLEQMPRVLASGGRLSAITFHSLEDRIVKRYMRAAAKPIEDAPGAWGVRRFVPPRFVRPFKPVTPTREECRDNRRARSARLRATERR